MNVFNLYLILLLIFRIIIARRHCDSTADCGFGGGCFKVNNTGICDCTISSRMFENNSWGECSRPVKNCDYQALKWKTKHFCGSSGKCINALGSFYCKCEEGCYGQFCKQCYNTKGGSRVDAPYFVYQIKEPLLKTRYIIVCHEKLGTNFSAYLSVVFPNQGSITRILSDKDFSMYKNPYDYCLTLNIHDQLCEFLPRSHTLCAEHPYIFPYEFVMSEKYTYRKNFYLISYDCGSTRTRHGFVRDFYFSGALSFYSDWKDKAFICAPLILIQDVGKTLNSMLYYREGFLFTLRVNTEDNPRCTEDYVFSLYSWKLFHVNQTWSPTYEPVAVQDGGSVFPIHEYTLPTTGMFKVEVWIHIITRVAEKPKMYLNFGYGYFYSDFSRPEPIIKGGTERTVPSNAVLVLDGTNSYGTTLPRLKDKRLIYIWSCNLTTLECADKETKDTFFKPNIILLPGMVIKFTLSVYYLPLQYMPDEAFTSTQIIRVAEKNVSEVLIICFCNCITEYFGVNPDEYFCLRASKLITSDDEKWDWKCYDKNTNTYLNIDEIREPDRDSSELVIKGGKLKQNRMYLFSVEDLSSSPGRAEMLITVDTQSVVNIRLYVTQTDSTGIYHKIFARGFYNLTKSHFAIYCEFFHKANSDNESDVMFAFNTGCLVKKAVLITGRIYVRFCDSRGSCSIKEGQVNVIRPSIQILNDMSNNLHNYFSNAGKLNDALMYTVTICHYVNYLKSKVKTVENILYILMKLDVYFFRDIYQIASIFVKCFAKRHELNHTNSTINIFLLRSAAEFLRKISMKIKTDVKTTFLNQVDHSENDYRNVGLLFIRCLDIILENKEIILSQPGLVNDIEILMQVHKLTNDIRSILENVSKFIGRRLIHGVTPVILKTKNIIFWLQKDELLKLSNRTIPTLNELDNNMKQKNQSKTASMCIPVSMARLYDKKFLHHILNVNIFNLNPFLSEPNGRKQFPAIIYTTLRRIKDKKYLYITDRYHRVKKHFNLFYNINYDSELINGTVALPCFSSNLTEKDKAIRVYRLLCDTGVFKIKFSNLTEKQELWVVFTKNMIPDYDIMMNEYLIVNRIKDTHIIDFQANQDSNSLCYIGILPGPKEKENNFVKYEFKISKIDCYVWTDIYTWVPGYCNVVVAHDTARSVYCQCKHFSGFTISSYPPSVWAVNVRDTFVNVDKIKNRFVGLFLLALLSLFIIFAILVYFLDRKDDFAAKVIILEDNIPGYRYPYLIGVYTGNRISGGTSATVGLQIYGKRGKSKVHVLKCSYRKVLTRGSDDWFIIFTKLSLGLLKYLHVWADFHGNNPSWFCSKIVVIDIDKNKEYVFILDEWLTIYLKEDAVLTHELSVADETEINSGAFITKYNTAIAIREGHIWSGLLCRHPRSNFRRVQRLGVLLFMVFSLSTVIFYFESDMFRKKTLDLPSFTAFDEDVMFKCILSLCIVLPFVFLLSYCFKKSTAANYYNTKEYAKKTKCFVPRSTEDLDNYSKNVQFISTLLMLQPLQPIVITDKENYVRKRRNKWTLIAWIAIAICVSIEFSILLYFGHNFPLRRSFKWILTTLFANCLSVFVIEPTILLFSSMILGYVLGVSQKESTILLHNEHKVKSYNDKLLSDGEFIEELYEIRSQYCYEPLAVKKERLIREIMYPKWCQKWSIVDLILILIYLLLFFFILKRFTVVECNMTSHHLNKLFSAGTRRSKGFFNISRQSEFLDFLAYNFLEKIHVLSYYSNDQIDADGEDKIGFLEDYFNRLVGVPRLRQQRVQRNSCLIPADFEDFYKVCNDMLEGNQDTVDYRKHWLQKTRPATEGVMGEIWNYMSEKQTRMFGVYGKSGKYYDGGGYVVKFGNNRKKSRTIVEYIREHDWMDDLTRVVFMEFLLYNVNTNIFTAVIFMAENFASGAFITKMMVQPLIVHQFNYGITDVIIILLVIIVISLVGARTAYLFQLYGVRFFHMIPNALNLIAFILGIILILLVTFHFYFDVLHANIQFNESSDDFLNLYKFILRERICIEFCAMFTAFAVVRLLFFWFFSPNYNLLSRMLYYTFIPIGIVLVILFCFCLIFLQYFPALLQNPAITSYSIFLTQSLNFNQIVKNTMINEKIFLAFLICVISGVACLVIRLLIMFFCSIAHYNLTYNLFNVIDKRSLASVIPDHLHRKSARSSLITSNDSWKSVTSQESSNMSTTWSDYRLAMLKESAINTLLSEKK